MTRFYFHVRENGALKYDPEGIDLRDVDAARNEADQAARDLVADQIVHGEKPDTRQFEVWDDLGIPHFILPFKSVIGSE